MTKRSHVNLVVEIPGSIFCHLAEVLAAQLPPVSWKILRIVCPFGGKLWNCWTTCFWPKSSQTSWQLEVQLAFVKCFFSARFCCGGLDGVKAYLGCPQVSSLPAKLLATSGNWPLPSSRRHQWMSSVWMPSSNSNHLPMLEVGMLLPTALCRNCQLAWGHNSALYSCLEAGQLSKALALLARMMEKRTWAHHITP